MTHTQRWHVHRKSVGTGHLYRGRYKLFPIQGGQHLLSVLRYVERDPVRAALVRRGEQWRWGSLWRKMQSDPELPQLLHPWPVPEPKDWLRQINRRKEPEEDLRSIRECARRGKPLGSADWQKRAAARLGLESTLRPRGGPKKEPEGQRKGT